MCDLNIVVYENGVRTDSYSVLSCIKRAYQLGFHTLALNVIITETELVGKKPFPSPIRYDIPEVCLRQARSQGKVLRLLTRLSTKVSDTAHVHKLQSSPIAAEYDLLAAYPTTDGILNSLVNHGAVDIIFYSLDTTGRWLKPNSLAFAVKRDIFVEFPYSTLLSKSPRTRALTSMLKISQKNICRGLIFSSGTFNVRDLRAPLDVSFLGYMFYLKGDRCRQMVWDNAERVLLHAETRRRKDRGAVLAQFQKKIPLGEEWVLEACKRADELPSSSKGKADDIENEKKKKRPLESDNEDSD